MNMNQRPAIDYKSLILICDCLDELLTQDEYFKDKLDNAKKDIKNDKVQISLDTYIELMDLMRDDVPALTEMIRNYAKKMENKLRQYKELQEGKIANKKAGN